MITLNWTYNTLYAMALHISLWFKRQFLYPTILPTTENIFKKIHIAILQVQWLWMTHFISSVYLNFRRMVTCLTKHVFLCLKDDEILRNDSSLKKMNLLQLSSKTENLLCWRFRNERNYYSKIEFCLKAIILQKK